VITVQQVLLGLTGLLLLLPLVSPALASPAAAAAAAAAGS
jgi:hypothetical protein